MAQDIKDSDGARALTDTMLGLLISRGPRSLNVDE